MARKPLHIHIHNDAWDEGKHSRDKGQFATAPGARGMGSGTQNIAARAAAKQVVPDKPSGPHGVEHKAEQHDTPEKAKAAAEARREKLEAAGFKYTHSRNDDKGERHYLEHPDGTLAYVFHGKNGDKHEASSYEAPSIVRRLGMHLSDAELEQWVKIKEGALNAMDKPKLRDLAKAHREIKGLEWERKRRADTKVSDLVKAAKKGQREGERAEKDMEKDSRK